MCVMISALLGLRINPLHKNMSRADDECFLSLIFHERSTSEFILDIWGSLDS